MGHLLGIRIQRYKALKDVVLGKHEFDRGKDDLPALTCLIGPNGSGKSTVLDAFGFLSDCLAENVEAACDKPHRGGFEKLRTKGETWITQRNERGHDLFVGYTPTLPGAG